MTEHTLIGYVLLVAWSLAAIAIFQWLTWWYITTHLVDRTNNTDTTINNE